MQVSIESTSVLERRLTIGVPADRVESEVNSRLQQAAQNVRIKGFRPGKVPMNVIRQRYGAGVRQEVLGEVMSRSFYEAVQQEKLKPAGRPSIEPKSVEPGKDLEYVATFEVFPVVDARDYSSIEVVKLVAELSAQDVEKIVVLKIRSPMKFFGAVLHSIIIDKTFENFFFSRMVNTINICSQAISSVIQKGSNSQNTNGITKVFLRRISLQFVQEILSLYVEILAFIGIEIRGKEV